MTNCHLPKEEADKVLLELPPFLKPPTRIIDELEADVDVNAVPGGLDLWQRVRDNDRYYTQTEVYSIYAMLGMPEPYYI